MENNILQESEALQEKVLLDSYKKELDSMGPFGLLQEIENLKKHKEFCEEQLSLSKEGLEKLEEWENVEAKLLKAKKRYYTLFGTFAGVASNLILTYSQKLVDISMSLSENLLAFGGMAGGGTLLGYAFYKLKKETECNERRAGAQKIINEQKDHMIEVKTFYEKEMKLTDKKISMTRNVVRVKEAQEQSMSK